ncbi:MAG: AAA family ATPase [Candidatus Atribacteria bacterium]|nr:AAA family ATPase [Candidatus Atribacteria bacterium]
MFLTHLNIHGFKSFAHPVTIEFHPGLNVIVGPNGSGKSNVIDALRWVLGDNFREMRVSQGREVIFHGAAGAKPLGMAFIETQWSESEDAAPYLIGRRIFASGESEYFLNQNRFRLKDLKEALRKFGFLVDRIGVAVVDNTKLQSLFEFRPSDKFSLFEMASGTYAVKEKLSLMKSSLVKIDEKLYRLKERENELNLQIEKVTEHAQQEEKYLHEEKLFIGLRKEYFNLLIQQRLKKIKELEGEKEKVEKELKRLEDERAHLELLFKKQQELHQEREELKSQVLERLENLRENMRSLEQQIYFYLIEARQREKNKLLNRETLQELRPQFDFLKKKVEDLQNNPLYHETFDELEGKEKEYQKRVTEFRIRKDSFQEQINQHKQEWSRLETSLHYLSEEFTVIEREQSSLDSLSNKLIQQIESTQKKMSLLQEENRRNITKREQLKERLDRKKTLLAKIRNGLREYEPEGKIDARIADRLKQLIQKGWPGKVIYAFNWLFKDYTAILKTDENLNFHPSSSKVGQGFIYFDALPPSDYWKIFTKNSIIDVLKRGEVPEVNMISSDGLIVYRRDGVLIFPRKRVTNQSGVRFYQSWQKKSFALQKRIQEGEKDISVLLAQENQLEKELTKIKGELQVIQLRYDDLQKERKKKSEKIELITQKKQSFQNEREKCGEQLDQFMREKEDIENQVNQLEDGLREIRTKRFEREKLRSTEEKLQGELATIETLIEKSISALQNIEMSRNQSLDVWKEIIFKIKKMNEEYQYELNRKKASFAAVDEIREKMSEIELLREKRKNEQDSLSHKKEKLSLQKEKWLFEVQEYTARLNEYQEWETNGLILPPYTDLQHLERMIKEKETRLKTWDIRRGSISQLRDLKERQNYIQDKLTYFQDAITRFEKSRSEYEFLCQELFYEFLLEVNFHFQNNFQRVFSGGKARIEIEEQNLEIIIQIPGKKKQRLSLLSSGEKALTALCLFFALFKAGGYHFCFFDEVDATLDHFNSVRLADLMKEFSRECQIIIVTHQEEIMEVSDRIIGVTMDEPGISRVVPLLAKNASLITSQN